jgi:precorrin-2 dehydrogenase/sirohydrochlorin ferrochelatase
VLEGVPGVTVERRGWVPGDLERAFVCVAASDDPSERAAIYQEARSRGALVNVMDDVPHCDFAAPAVVRRGALAIAVSTGGLAPALARALRVELEERFGPEWADIVDVVGEARSRTLAELPDLPDRISRWRTALDVPELVRLVKSGRRGDAKRRLIGRLLRGVAQPELAVPATAAEGARR